MKKTILILFILGVFNFSFTQNGKVLYLNITNSSGRVIYPDIEIYGSKVYEGKIKTDTIRFHHERGELNNQIIYTSDGYGIIIDHNFAPDFLEINIKHQEESMKVFLTRFYDSEIYCRGYWNKPIYETTFKNNKNVLLLPKGLFSIKELEIENPKFSFLNSSGLNLKSKAKFYRRIREEGKNKYKKISLKTIKADSYKQSICLLNYFVFDKNLEPIGYLDINEEKQIKFSIEFQKIISKYYIKNKEKINDCEKDISQRNYFSWDS